MSIPSSKNTTINQDYQPHANGLQQRVIAVTGAGDGIGRCIAITLAHHGATVILLGRTLAKLEAVYDTIEANKNTNDSNSDTRPVIVTIDFATAGEDEYKSIAESIDNTFGKLDGLIHNAAELGSRTSINTYRMDTWERLMRVNVNAPFALTKYCLPLLQKSDSASILFTGSSVGIQGRAYWGAYAASKAANENMMQTLADELKDTSNIRVNSINPGATRTAMRAEAFPAEDPNTVKVSDSLMPLYLFLMHHDSIDITGQQFSYANINQRTT